MLYPGQYFSKYTYRIFKNLEKYSSTPKVKIDRTLEYVVRLKIPITEEVVIG